MTFGEIITQYVTILKEQKVSTKSVRSNNPTLNCWIVRPDILHKI